MLQSVLQKRKLILLLTGFFSLVGLSSYLTMPRESSPDITIPIYYTNISMSGAAPEDIDDLIINPLTKELKALSNLDNIKSTASEGVGTVVIQFESGIDTDIAYQDVKDAIDKAKSEFPQEADEPVIKEINLSETPIVILSLFGNLGKTELYEIAEELGRIARNPTWGVAG